MPRKKYSPFKILFKKINIINRLEKVHQSLAPLQTNSNLNILAWKSRIEINLKNIK